MSKAGYYWGEFENKPDTETNITALQKRGVELVFTTLWKQGTMLWYLIHLPVDSSVVKGRTSTGWNLSQDWRPAPNGRQTRIQNVNPAATSAQTLGSQISDVAQDAVISIEKVRSATSGVFNAVVAAAVIYGVVKVFEIVRGK